MNLIFLRWNFEYMICVNGSAKISRFITHVLHSSFYFKMILNIRLCAIIATEIDSFEKKIGTFPHKFSWNLYTMKLHNHRKIKSIRSNCWHTEKFVNTRKLNKHVFLELIYLMHQVIQWNVEIINEIKSHISLHSFLIDICSLPRFRHCCLGARMTATWKIAKQFD